MLTPYDPPGFLPGLPGGHLRCCADAGPRNYDYDPELCERVVYSSAFTGRRVIGTVDRLWGCSMA
jgi:hypothetical protein